MELSHHDNHVQHMHKITTILKKTRRHYLYLHIIHSVVQPHYGKNQGGSPFNYPERKFGIFSPTRLPCFKVNKPKILPYIVFFVRKMLEQF